MTPVTIAAIPVMCRVVMSHASPPPTPRISANVRMNVFFSLLMGVLGWGWLVRKGPSARSVRHPPVICCLGGAEGFG